MNQDILLSGLYEHDNNDNFRIILNKLCSFIDAGVRFNVISFRVTSHCPTFIMMNYLHTTCTRIRIYTV
jgi:hypothetical protein